MASSQIIHPLCFSSEHWSLAWLIASDLTRGQCLHYNHRFCLDAYLNSDFSSEPQGAQLTWGMEIFAEGPSGWGSQAWGARKDGFLKEN